MSGSTPRQRSQRDAVEVELSNHDRCFFAALTQVDSAKESERIGQLAGRRTSLLAHRLLGASEGLRRRALTYVETETSDSTGIVGPASRRSKPDQAADSPPGRHKLYIRPPRRSMWAG